MPTIASLKPDISLDEACRRFNTTGVRGSLRRLMQGRLRLLAQIYVPFDVFSVEIDRGEQVEIAFLALDAVSGALDPYSFERLPGNEECVAIESRNVLPRTLPPAAVQEALLHKVRRQLYQRGFFRIRQLQIRMQLQPLRLHVPYWVGFFGSDTALRLAALDAVRGVLEGGKVRALLRQWFAGELLPAHAPSIPFPSESSVGQTSAPRD